MLVTVFVEHSDEEVREVRTLLSNLNDHRTVIVQYYFASNSDSVSGCFPFTSVLSFRFSHYPVVVYEE